MTNTADKMIDDSTITWELPERGRVGMFGLIAAESAIFTIFVVAYIFYLGKSLTGPTPKEVLDAPVFYTICLLSSSLTIHLPSGASVRETSLRSQSSGWQQLRWARPFSGALPPNGIT